MPPLNARIKKLLREPESTTLDVKRDQYPIANATDEQKSELIKDIISFANTPRTTNAHILIGISEQQGGKRTITGITNHHDDAHLQQLINKKTNRPVQFSYHAHTIDDKEIGIITIPPQPRLTYLKKDYGTLRANTVYLRHGSSTASATPDEIARMQTPDPPTLDLQLANITERQQLGTHLQLTSIVLHTPTQIPDLTAKIDILNGLFNRNYYRELIRYAAFDQLTTRVGLAITNTSTTTAHDIKLTITIDDPESNVTIALNAPPEPDQLSHDDTPHKRTKTSTPPTDVHRTARAWHIITNIPKVQPRQTHYLREQLYIGAATTTSLTLNATMHADNLPEPITTSLTIDITATERTATLIDALAIYNLD